MGWGIVCVDLDGCLVETDTLPENALGLIGQNPLKLFTPPIWLCRGRAHLKQRIAATTTLDIRALPCNQRVLDYLRTQKNVGSRIVLVTAADRLIAEKVAKFVDPFDEVLASDGGKRT